MSRPIFVAYVAAMTVAFAVASMIVVAPPVAAQDQATINRMDEQWFAYWQARRHPATSAIEVQVADDEIVLPERDPILPPPSEWYGDIRICDADHNPPKGFTNFGGFCDQTEYPDRQSLLFTGTDAIFGFKHN